MAPALFLCGMPGSGKSKLGKKLASRLKIKFIDLDFRIEEEYGISPATWINTKGEEAFRLAEAETLRRIPLDEPVLVACGGGTPCFQNNLEYMLAHGKVVRIDVPLQTLVQRLSQNTGDRPLLADGNLADRLAALWEDRKGVYLLIEHVLYPLKQGDKEMVELCRNWMNQHR